MTKKKIRFAIIGCGLMGREFASAAARWCHMTADIPAPEIVGVSDLNPNARQWFCDNFDTVKYSTADYTELLDKEDIDAVYCAVPHNLHEKIYIDIINAGKHLLGEKPFGIDAEANRAIMDSIKAHPEVIVRCSSEFPYYPACQKLIEWIREGKFGKIIEVRSAFCHSSDMDTQKPINWKRTLSINGEYGCMGDLGIHTEHVPFRMGWKPLNVFAKLSNIVTERPDGKGNIVPCETWDNAILLCDVKDVDGSVFPMMYETKRLSPGSTNEWRLEVYGLEASAKFSTNDPGAFCYTQSLGKEQAWCRVNVGYKPMIPTITGGRFEFGSTDSILQMWGAVMGELSGMEVPFGCVTPEETELSHKLQTAALLSNKTGRLVTIE